MKPWVLSFALLVACESDTSEKVAPQSRVQAVLATSPGSSAATLTKAVPANASSAGASAAALKAATPKVPLCAGQMDLPAATFAPKTTPDQRHTGEQPRLALDPFEKGKRWTWVNFWAAWCVPCKQEMPLLLKWQEQLQAKLNFVFVSLDDDERQLAGFLKEQPKANGLHSSYWLPDGPVRMGWLQALGLQSEPELPMQLLIDPAGKLRCKIQGSVEPEDLPELKRLLSL
jgi:thiol-disulfide isomerase/thioredoxin